MGFGESSLGSHRYDHQDVLVKTPSLAGKRHTVGGSPTCRGGADCQTEGRFR